MDLTNAEKAILQSLAKLKKPGKAQPLAKAAKISYNYFQQAIDVLIEAGLVGFETDESKKGRGRKPYVYWITAKGRKLV